MYKLGDWELGIGDRELGIGKDVFIYVFVKWSKSEMIIIA